MHRRNYPNRPEAVYFFGTCLIDLLLSRSGSGRSPFARARRGGGTLSTGPELLRLRREGVDGDSVRGAGSRRYRSEAAIWKLWAWWNDHPRLYRLGLRLITTFGFLTPKRLGPWTSVREAPRPAARSLHQMVTTRSKP